MNHLFTTVQFWMVGVMTVTGGIASVAVMLRMAIVTGHTWSDPINRRLGMIAAGLVIGSIVLATAFLPGPGPML
ncbi:hypothetical protein [Rhodococcus sp. 077-4]|uniref:hypothetical protein n=1 Tax=Rhodococcus sp. 077-4 TaxID=2789271 RepID=UPI0039F59D88